MNKKLLVTICKVLIFGTFFAPLAVIPNSFIFPFIVPKILIMRTLITLLLGSYVLLLVSDWQEYKPKFTILNVVLFAFLLILWLVFIKFRHFYLCGRGSLPQFLGQSRKNAGAFHNYPLCGLLFCVRRGI